MCRIIYSGSVWLCYRRFWAGLRVIFPVCDVGPSPGCKCHPERTETQITAQMFKTCHTLPAVVRFKSCKCKYLRWFSIYEWGITDVGTGESTMTTTWFKKKKVCFWGFFYQHCFISISPATTTLKTLQLFLSFSPIGFGLGFFHKILGINIYGLKFGPIKAACCR